MHPSNPINVLAEKPSWPRFRPKRVAFVVALLLLALVPGEFGTLTRALVADGFINVAAFVAVTLFVFYFSEEVLGVNLAKAMNRAGAAQIPIAALLGILPGCGGTVVVVSAYTAGHVSFGAVVAALTATMGDGAFLLLAKRPDAALVVLPVSFVAGIVTGWLVQRFHKPRFRADRAPLICELTPRIGRIRGIDWTFAVLTLPSLVIGVAAMAQVELTALAGVPALWIGLAGAAVSLAIWATSPLDGVTNPTDPATTRTSEETGVIFVWVISAFLIYDYAATLLGLDLTALFATVAPLLPLVAILIGFIPGCGPQILVVTLYINGVVPFAALIGNAISNDGDALFPAIALNPRAAMVATIYSAVPAVVVAYAFWFFAPGFMN